MKPKKCIYFKTICQFYKFVIELIYLFTELKINTKTEDGMTKWKDYEKLKKLSHQINEINKN